MVDLWRCASVDLIGTRGTIEMSKAWTFDFANRSVFAGTPRIAPDPKPSAAEDRLIAVGRTEFGRPVFVAFTLRRKGNSCLIRPVTARYMHAKEIEAFEKESSKP